MPRSRAARRRARQRRNAFIGPLAPASMGRRRMGGQPFDWLASQYSMDGTGAPQTGGSIVNGWYGTAVVTNSAPTQSVAAAVIVPAPSTSTPTVGRLRVDEIRGRVYFDNGGTAAATFHAAVAIYVGDLNNTTTLWNARNPLNVTEASRDDYLLLETVKFNAPSEATSPSNAMELPCIDISIPVNVIIGGGQAVIVTGAIQGFQGSDTGTAEPGVITFAFRTRVGPVA